MPKLIDMAGRKFGRLTVLARGENRGRKTCWRCRCACGRETEVPREDLTRYASCGCLRYSGKQKTQRKTSSRYKGVSWSIRRHVWGAAITHNGRQIHLGWYTQEHKAALAYDAAAIRLHGDLAATNKRLGLLADLQKSTPK